ncbi:MAG: protein-L-isoaspartate(D-aspartate) O-methyltransferase [Calditrichaeota bacterium]|nr:MAG: protein-L-isoaspartate(D-aspartate) O-methyltransferase [Calditrichota bacterium]MBL1205305.1 protein-L-isoaspartate(D-aspartate) O-methyltransferase [Calditrichota bacterium]NOG45134.1 protein-L-isoaspartate(D-aspartate) O-methyltransferase [Calditrichota bacterium]
MFFVFSCTSKNRETMAEDQFTQLRSEMVKRQILARGVKDTLVINAMKTVPRHKFVPEEDQAAAYNDEARSIGKGQTISQPYIVAFMTDELRIKPGDRVLEIGTGSGYQASILAQIADTVYSMEIIEELAESAQKTITSLGYENIIIKQGDGYLGWPEQAPFDAIMVTAAPSTIPPRLLEQLKVGGRMILPVGKYVQELVVISKNNGGHTMDSVLPVRFVPMTGKIQEEEEQENQD